MERRTFMRVGFALLLAEVGYWLVLFAHAYLIYPLLPEMEVVQAIDTIVLTILLYVAMAMIAKVVLSGLPEAPANPLSPFSPSMFFVLVVICLGVGYLLAYGGYYVHYYFELGLKDALSPFHSFPDPVEQAETTGLLHLADILGAIIMAPIFEEYIFRKILLDKLRPFGDRIAILLTSISFGLTHLNFQQFFFAMFVGLIFGYIVIRTGRLIYSIVLHFIYNSFSTLIIPFLMRLDNVYPLLGTLLVDGIIFSFMAIGVTIFFCTLKKIRLDAAPFRFSRRVNGGLILGNAGIILYLILCILLFLFCAYLDLQSGNYELSAAMLPAAHIVINS